jgi:hypothetical protein
MNGSSRPFLQSTFSFFLDSVPPGAICDNYTHFRYRTTA